MENIWIYTVNDGDFGGIVIANTKEEAERKVREMLICECYIISNPNDVIVWKATMDDDYNEDCPDVLGIY